jgi:hypothetical protein
MTAPLVDWPAVYPYGLFGKDLEPGEFTRRYRVLLHRQRRRVLAELEELLEAYGDLVLLCFERSDAFCCSAMIPATDVARRKHRQLHEQVDAGDPR